MNRIVKFVFLCLVVTACDNSSSTESAFPSPPMKVAEESALAWNSKLTREVYFDKVLGMILGSAIGDAMGAPTEMWHRDDITRQLGYVSDLDAVVREGSPEGPWATNLPGGGTTDDTRWKYLIADFFETQDLEDTRGKDFAKFIVDLYVNEKREVNQEEVFEPEEIETQVRHMTWLQEWAKVAKPYAADDLQGYTEAANRFYGGEMSCAGMLYAPGIGAYYPGDPVRAYQESYALSLFDIGYAKDITGLTAAYVSKAMEPGIAVEDIGSITRTVDPQHYFESRLVGRIANRFYQDAKSIAYEAKGIGPEDIAPDMRIPKNYLYPALYFAQVRKAYELMDEKLQDIPFHAGEIHLINLTAIEFCEGDFKKAMEFVVNYGRDNDTVAAVTGAILGAHSGADKLPQQWKDVIIKVNKERVGIDLVDLAERITEKAFPK